MGTTHLKTIAAAFAATIVASIGLCSCEGRKMSNMEPNGETVEVVVDTHADSIVETPEETPDHI